MKYVISCAYISFANWQNKIFLVEVVFVYNISYHNYVFLLNTATSCPAWKPFRSSLQRCHEFLLVEKCSAQRVVVTWNQAIFEKLPLVLKIYANLQDRSGNILAINQLFLEGKRPKIYFWLIAWGLLLGVSQKAQKTILFITDRLFYHESNINGN